MARILVGFSGGVDSAVAAHLLREAGHEVAAVTLRLLPSDATVSPAVAAERLSTAQRLARRMGFEHEVWDLAAEFEREVIAPFVETYAAGRTPNPCVLCNAHIKLGAYLARAQAGGWERIATGHYVRKVPLPPGAAGPVGLACARDREKDQAYMLWAVDPLVLPLVEFPLGMRTKEEVLEIAGEIGIAAEIAPESQDLCFIGEGGYTGFLSHRLRPEHPGWQAGALVDQQGRALGRHRGCLHYTVGQRRGLGVGSPTGEPLYVTAIDPASQRVAVGTASALERRAVEATACRCFVPGLLAPGNHLMARIRYRQAARPGEVTSVRGEAVRFRFDEPVRGVAAGQSLVLFHEDLLIAGGFLV